MSTRNIALTIIVFLGFALGRILDGNGSSITGNLVLAILPIFLVWILLRYKHPSKKQRKLTMAAFLVFGLAFYIFLIGSLMEKYNSSFFEKYRLVFAFGALIPFIIATILLIINRILFYDDKNSLL